MKMKFFFELRTRMYDYKTWDNTVDFCVDHDKFMPFEYQGKILDIASEHGLHRVLNLLEDKRGMQLLVTMPSDEIFSHWLMTRINYFYEVKNSEVHNDSDEIPVFPHSFQKVFWRLSNFTPLMDYEIFWKAIVKGIKMTEKECTIDPLAFCEPARKVYYDKFYS